MFGDRIIQESDYKAIEELGALLGIPVPMAYISTETRDIDSGALLDEYHDRSRTWVRNFWNTSILFAACGITTDSTTFGSGHINVKDVSGTIRGSSSSHNINPSTPGAGITTY